MFEPKTLYSLNKLNPDAIVYMDADKRLVRLTREDFATEEEFLTWKAWSDEDFHEEEKGDHIYANHTRSLVESPGAGPLSVPGPESAAVRKSEREEQARKIALIRDALTEKQFRRLWLYCAKGKTEDEIAAIEGTTQQGVSKSISAARKKISEVFPSEDALEVIKER